MGAVRVYGNPYPSASSVALYDSTAVHGLFLARLSRVARPSMLATAAIIRGIHATGPVHRGKVDIQPECAIRRRMRPELCSFCGWDWVGRSERATGREGESDGERVRSGGKKNVSLVREGDARLAGGSVGATVSLDGWPENSVHPDSGGRDSCLDLPPTEIRRVCVSQVVDCRAHIDTREYSLFGFGGGSSLKDGLEVESHTRHRHASPLACLPAHPPTRTLLVASIGEKKVGGPPKNENGFGSFDIDDNAGQLGRDGDWQGDTGSSGSARLLSPKLLRWDPLCDDFRDLCRLDVPPLLGERKLWE